MPESSYNTLHRPQTALTALKNSMKTLKRHFKKSRQKSRARRWLQAALVLLPVVVLTTSCEDPNSGILPADAAMLEQWEGDRAGLLESIEACQKNDPAARLSAQYQKTDDLITIPSLETFGDCELTPFVQPADTPNIYSIQYLAKDDNSEMYLVVASQKRIGTGWIEETASRWTGGLVSWKTSILEEKGFVYVAQPELIATALPLPSVSIADEPLDQFSGRYRGTSQISGNSSCEIWRLRPIDNNWYLFYHQSRECPL